MILVRILNLFDGDRVAAAKYCMGIATRFPQFSQEFLDYADFLHNS